MLHGPTEEDRRAVHASVERRRAEGPPSRDWARDEALALAAADRSNTTLFRGFCWFAWAYNCSPLRFFLDAVDAPLLIVEGVLPALWRWLAFLPLPPERVAAYWRDAWLAPRRSSGWLGCLVVLPVWTGLSLLTLWLLLVVL